MFMVPDKAGKLITDVHKVYQSWYEVFVTVYIPLYNPLVMEKSAQLVSLTNMIPKMGTKNSALSRDQSGNVSDC